MVRKIAAFDVFGTCFGFDNLVNAVEQEFGSDLKAAGTTPAHLVMSWFYATQRDFTYLSVCGNYTPIGKVFAATLPRALAIALDPAPQYPSTSRKDSFPEDKLSNVVSQLKTLPARPGLIDAFETLWKAGFEVYPVTNGAIESTKGLFAKIESPHKPGIFTSGEFDKFVISCDEVQKAKPNPEIYKHALERANADASKDTIWFVSAHNWDLIAAKKAGFKTAYVTFEEIVAVEELFGKPDVTEDGLAKAAKSIVAASQ